MAKVYIEGMKELRHNLRRFPGELKKATGAGEYVAAQDIVEDAQRRVPEESGDLKNSIYALKPQETNDSVFVEIGAAASGEAQAYGYLQHEMPYTHPGERAKKLGVTKVGEQYFLKNAIESLARSTKDTIAKYVDHFIKTGRVKRATKRVRDRR